MLASYMDRQRSVTTESNSAKSSASVRSRNGKKRTSRLDEMREKFHHRLMQEKEQKLVAIYERQQQQALNKIGRTFRHEKSVESSPRTVKTAGGIIRADVGEKERPRQRAVLGGKHNALEPLEKAPRPSLPRPSVPNMRYNSHVSLPYDNATRGGFASEKGAKIPPGRSHLSRHPKLPAVGDKDTRDEDKVVTSERKRISETDTLAEQLARKQQEMFLQLQRKQTDLEAIQKQRREVDKEVMLDSDMNINSFSTTSVKRQITNGSRRSFAKSVGSNEEQEEDYVGNSGNFETKLESALQEAAASSSSATMDFVPCSICGRKFAAERVAKHVSVCEKSNKKKRKIFDTVKMRTTGTEAVMYRPNKRNATAEQPGKKSNWRAAHDDFIKTVRAARQMQEHIKKGGKLSDLPPPPPTENAHYVQCPHCQRKFNPATAERHIPKCKDIKHRPAPPRTKRK